MLLGQRIRELRNIRGETLKDTSNGTNLSVSYLSDIERGRTNPSLQSLETLAKHLDISVTDLLAGVESAGLPSDNALPPGLADLLQDRNLGPEIDDDWVQLLQKINLRGKRPQTKLEWLELYLSLKRILDTTGE
ncbi:MAG TPA: helix-turn-helix transcriptional regulator [Thermodesulfobacteriota bacterium]